MAKRLASILKRRRTVVGAPCSERARRWVHGYAVGGAAFAVVPIPVLGSTTAGLVALETTMIHSIGRIYGIEVEARDAAAIAAGLEIAGGAIKVVARQAAGMIPVVGWLVRGAIAAVTIEALGNAVIAHFESRAPGRLCAATLDEVAAAI